MKVCLLFLFVFVGVGVCSEIDKETALNGSTLLKAYQLSVNLMNNSAAPSEGDFASYQEGFCVAMVIGVSDTSPNICAPKGSKLRTSNPNRP